MVAITHDAAIDASEGPNEREEERDETSDT